MSSSVPLAGHTIARTTDLDVARHLVGRSLSPHRLDVRGSRLDLTHNATTFGRIGVHYIDYGTDVDVITDGLPFVLVQIPLAGQTVVHAGGAAVDVAPGQAVVTAVGEPVRMAYSAHNPRLMLRVTARDLAGRARAVDGVAARLASTVVLDLTSGPGRTLGALVDISVTQLRNTPARSDLPLTASLSVAVIDSLVGTLVHHRPRGWAATEPNASDIGLSPAGQQALRRAVAIIHGHCAETLSVADVATAAGTSTRTLQAAFRARHGVSPGTYIRRARLEHIRHDLRTGDDDSVTEVALRWGVTHLGRFAHDYRTLFGELPSETLRGRASEAIVPAQRE